MGSGSSHIPTSLLQHLKDVGLMPKLYKAGIISVRTVIMLEVRQKVDALMRQGRSKGEAVREVAKSMRLHKSTIYAYL